MERRLKTNIESTNGEKPLEDQYKTSKTSLMWKVSQIQRSHGRRFVGNAKHEAAREGSRYLHDEEAQLTPQDLAAEDASKDALPRLSNSHKQ